MAPDDDSLRERFEAMRAAHAADPLPGWPERERRLRALETLVREHRGDIAAAIHADFGHRPAQETDLLEVFPSLSGIRHALRHGRRWMRLRRAAAGFWFLPAHTEIRPRPLGVVGVIVPWNYPLYLAIGPITDAIAAGNRVLVKTSEWTPAFSALFARLVERYFAPAEVAVATGDADVARAFSALPFDHLLFTGSTAVGRDVMRAAAANLTPVTLELGGKSPAIIAPDARFEHAVERILVGKLMNAGQTCIAPDYVLLPRARMQAFIDAARATVARLYPDFAANAEYAAIASDRHLARLAALRDEAVAGGARAHELVATAGDGRRFAPTVLTGVAPGMRILEEEIFGPLLPLLPYDELDEAIAHVAAREHPLALYVFAESRASVERVLRRAQAGGVTVNDTLLHIAQHHLPFGGVGASGIGAYHGEHGFRRFSHLEPVFRQARWNAVGLLNPPYRGVFRRLLSVLLRRG
ncbi:MAG TPA: coniferyl aldehyde dehydrogenase [Dokdonella sp.]